MSAITGTGPVLVWNRLDVIILRVEPLVGFFQPLIITFQGRHVCLQLFYGILGRSVLVCNLPVLVCQGCISILQLLCGILGALVLVCKLIYPRPEFAAIAFHAGPTARRAHSTLLSLMLMNYQSNVGVVKSPFFQPCLVLLSRHSTSGGTCTTLLINYSIDTLSTGKYF